MNVIQSTHCFLMLSSDVFWGVGLQSDVGLHINSHTRSDTSRHTYQIKGRMMFMCIAPSLPSFTDLHPCTRSSGQCACMRGSFHLNHMRLSCWRKLKLVEETHVTLREQTNSTKAEIPTQHFLLLLSGGTFFSSSSLWRQWLKKIIYLSCDSLQLCSRGSATCLWFMRVCNWVLIKNVSGARVIVCFQDPPCVSLCVIGCYRCCECMLEVKEPVDRVRCNCSIWKKEKKRGKNRRRMWISRSSFGVCVAKIVLTLILTHLLPL